jgi:alpha-galactosidase
LDVRYQWNELELPLSKYAVRDLWERKDLGTMENMNLTLLPHASVLYRVAPAP